MSVHSLGRLKGLRFGAMLGIPVHVALAFMPWYPAVLFLRMATAICCRAILLSAISLGESLILFFSFIYLSFIHLLIYFITKVDIKVPAQVYTGESQSVAGSVCKKRGVEQNQSRARY